VPNEASPLAPERAPHDLRDRSVSFEAEALPHLADVARFALALTRTQADADDLVQDTFLRAFRGWHTYRPGTDARRWLFTICKHVFLRRTRDRKHWVELDGTPESETLAAVHLHADAQRMGLDDLFDRLDVGPAVARALDALPEHYRVVVALVDVEGQSYEEAAAVLDVPIGTIRSRLFRARRMLQQSLLIHARDAGLLATRRSSE
jgi:RNA polymerase sigma-70 factor (ECF subfamily)